MTTPPESLEAARARVHEQAAQARQRNEALRSLAGAVESATGTARSANGAITVTAAATGAITSIQFTESALDAGAAALGTQVTMLIGTAQRAALTRTRDISAAEVGDHHPLVAELDASAQRYGPAASDLRTTPEPRDGF